jgi:predicted  nucleic acid-binding Zn-ribbon protein
MASTGENNPVAPRTPGGSSSTTWARAKAASHQLILQAAMEDLETKAAKLEKQVHEYKVQLGAKEEKLSDKTNLVEKLTGDFEKANATLVSTRSELTSKISECKTFEESSKTNGERVDRQAAESDALREEIR